MKTLLTLLFPLFLSPISLFCQSFQFTVNNGYGTKILSAGDTAHLWAEAFGLSRTFSHWSGDTSFLERPEEWHTRVIMPAQNVTVTAHFKTLPTGNSNPLSFETMMGRDTIKRVFSYFPSNAAPLGVCWLWHGTGGSANSWVGGDFEQFQFVKYLVANGWGVIVTESEESTKNKDLNGDGNLRYDFSGDTLNNVDFQNIRAIRDTFINRGKITWATPHASVGFSAGGAFSTMLAAVFNWNASVTHCAPGISQVLQVATTPVSFSMNLFDDHPDVGSAGNLEAFENWEDLVDKGQCTEFYLLRPAPVYPERFNRLPGINLALSASIHQELVSNGCFGPAGFLKKAPAEVQLDVLANPSNWPVVLSLTGTQRQFVLDQLYVLWTSHHFHSDFMAADFKFISNPCNGLVAVQNPENESDLQVFPNPTHGLVTLSKAPDQVRVFDLNGKMVLSSSNSSASEVDLTPLPAGLYFLETEIKGAKQLSKLVKI